LLSQIELKQDIHQAIKTLKKVIPVYENNYGTNHFETNQVKTTLALYLLKTQQAEQATAILLSLYDSQKQQLGENHQATLYVVLNLIKAYDLAGNYTKAIELGEDALSRSQQHLGKEFIITIGIQMALAKTYLNNKQATLAIKTLKPLLSMKIITGNPTYHKRVALLLAQAFFNNQQFKAANQLIAQILSQYYSNGESLDENYHKLISFKSKKYLK
jgi:tetratricopeptide (TPR) repeat protein